MLKINGVKLVRIKSDNFLAEGNFGQVYTLATDSSVVIKVFKECSEVEAEFKAQLAAYEYSLAPKPLAHGWTDGYEYQYLSMERVYQTTPLSLTQGELNQFKAEFLTKLKAYHSAGWSHGDIKRPVDYVEGLVGGKWDNIWLTKTGIILLDYGMFIRRSDDDPFGEFDEQANKDLKDWGEYSNQLIK
jgi:serine/threonine protein kinase